MGSRKFWLVTKGVLIILFTAMIFVMPTQDTFRKGLRFAMLTLFVVSFIIDLNRYKNND